MRQSVLQNGRIRNHFVSKQNKKTPLTGDLYSKFLTEAAPAIDKVFKNIDVTPIFQDDQDNKHRTTLVRSTVTSLFGEPIEIRVGDAKFTDTWSTEKV